MTSTGTRRLLSFLWSRNHADGSTHSDGKADFVWIDPRTGAAKAWLNNYPNSPRWLEQPEMARGVGASGSSVRFAVLQDTGRASYVAVDPNNGAISASLNGCKDLGPPPNNNTKPCVAINAYYTIKKYFVTTMNVVAYEDGKKVCEDFGVGHTLTDDIWTMKCSGITIKGKYRGAGRTDVWHYDNTKSGVTRDIPTSGTGTWSEQCKDNDPRDPEDHWTCLFATFASIDTCGMVLKPIAVPDS